MEVTLVAVKSNGAQRELTMKRARMVLGRKKECDIRVPVPSVSREHCEVRVENGKVMVRDLGSSNGTYVNQQRVQEAELTAGQLLGIGPAVFVVRIDGAPDKIDPKKAALDGAAPEPVASASAPSARPTAPGKETRVLANAPSMSDSSISDFDLDMLDDDDLKKQPRL